MLDLAQSKLTKSEWEGTEMPYPEREAKVIRLISESGNDLNLEMSILPTLSDALKIKGYQNLVFNRYVGSQWNTIAKEAKVQFGFEASIPKLNEARLRKADVIKFNNLRLEYGEDGILELEALAILRGALRSRRKENPRWLIQYYTFCCIKRSSFGKANKIVSQLASQLMEHIDASIVPHSAVRQGVDMLENNPLLHKYAPLKLYNHQRDLIREASDSSIAKLILYSAPTGTGKTLTPIGLINRKSVIFMCAARHIGLALARAAIYAEKAVAFAFGCSSESDVRLHYAAASRFTKDNRTGGIRRVDNTVGTKVQLIVCDMRSYKIAMNYMLKYNSPSELVWYWDEPTMTLDASSHPCHELIRDNWETNAIPTVVLCSATLPSPEELKPVELAFCSKFERGQLMAISSHDFKKTISVLNKEGFAQSPHSSFNTVAGIREAVQVCCDTPTILRYVDLTEVIIFIDKMWAQNEFKLPEELVARTAFPTLQLVTMENIKKYYLQLVKVVPDRILMKICNELNGERRPRLQSTIYASSGDAHTLTDGPTIFICGDTNKVGMFLLQQAKIPETEIGRITAVLTSNEKAIAGISQLEQRLQDLTAKDIAAGRSKKLSELNRGGDETVKIRNEIKRSSMQIKPVGLDSKYIPNKPMHLRKYGLVADECAAFTSTLDESDITKVIDLADVSIAEKLLLMLGVGVFRDTTEPKYLELIKQLASEQKLYLIVASADYAYGTNYQFCHGYVGIGLTKQLSRDKIIQAFGRVGRGKCQQTYSIRIRDNKVIGTLFSQPRKTPELDHLIRLLC